MVIWSFQIHSLMCDMNEIFCDHSRFYWCYFLLWSTVIIFRLIWFNLIWAVFFATLRVFLMQIHLEKSLLICLVSLFLYFFWRFLVQVWILNFIWKYQHVVVCCCMLKFSFWFDCWRLIFRLKWSGGWA